MCAGNGKPTRAIARSEPIPKEKSPPSMEQNPMEGGESLPRPCPLETVAIYFAVGRRNWRYMRGTRARVSTVQRSSWSSMALNTPKPKSYT